MKKTILLAVVVGMLSIGAQAFAFNFWTGQIYNPNVGMVGNIQGMDWSSSGSGGAIGYPAGGLLLPGQTFTFDYQAVLVGVTDPAGNPVLFPGVTDTFEYSVAATFPEMVTALVPVGADLISQFTTLPGGKFAMFYELGHNVDILNGTGFVDGLLVAEGTIDGGAVTTFTASAPGVGTGATTLTGHLTYVDNAYFNPGSDILNFRFEGTLNLPALDSYTNTFFNESPAVAGWTPTSTAGQTVFKVDGSSKFEAVPEPSTFVLLGAGLLGMVGLARKRVRK